MRARTVAQVVAGEAVSGTPEERMADMRAIASVIANRAQQLGITPEEVVANTNEFNAYNRALPPGVGEDLVAMAQEQIDYVAENGPVHAATFYATPAATDNLPGNLSFETETAGHQFFSDPLGRAIGTANGYVQPNQYAYAQNLENVPTPSVPSTGILSGWSEMAASDPVEVEPGHPGWGLNKNVAPALTPTVETWSDMAAAAPVSAPMGSVTAQGFLGANPSLAANASVPGSLGAQPQAISQADVDRAFFNATGSGQMDPAFTAGLMSPQNPVVPTAVESQSFTPGMQTASAPAPISQADVDRAFFNATGAGQLDPSFTAGLMGHQNPVIPTSVESVSYTQGQEPSAEFASAPAEKTSRFGNMPNLADAARMNPLAGAIDPATNVTSFMDQPADIGGFLDAMAAQRGPATGINSAEHQTQVANAMRQQFNPSIQAPTPEVATGGFLNNPEFAATNFNAAINPSVPSLNVPTVTPTDQQKQAAATMPAIPGMLAQPSVASAYAAPQVATPAEQAIEQQITPGLLSPTSITASTPTLTGGINKGILADQGVNQVGFFNDLTPNIDINLSGNIVPAAATDVAAPALETVDVAEQPTVAAQDETVEGPATTPAVEQQQQTQPTTATRTTPAVKTTPSIANRLASVVNPGTAIGAAVGGGLLGVPGAAIGGFLGNAVNQGGFLSSDPVSVNNIGSGSDAVYSVWGGAQPIGTQATASDGQQVTSMGNGYTALTGKSGAITVFDQNGKAMSYFGSALGNDEDAETASSSTGGGFFGGLFG